MLIIGCDFHPGFQQVAIFDNRTGEMEQKRLQHRAEAEQFYRSLAGQEVLVGMEACGHYPWFERLLEELGIAFWFGDAAKIRASVVRKQQMQNSRLDAGPLQHSEPCRPCPLGKCGTPGQAVDLQLFRRNAQRAKPRRGCCRLAPRLRAQMMIHHQCQQRSAALPRPGVGQQRQGHAVGAARDTGRNPRRRLERPERRHDSGKFLAGDHSPAPGPLV